MENLSRGFSILAVVFMLLGLLFNLYPKIPRIPGDINIDLPSFKIYIPIISAIIISIILTILLNTLRI